MRLQSARLITRLIAARPPARLTRHDFSARAMSEPTNGAANGSAAPAGAAAGPSKKDLKAERKAAAKAKAELKAKAAPAESSTSAKAEGKKKEKPAPASTPATQPFVNHTPPGEKKGPSGIASRLTNADLSGEMAAGYDPEAVEAAWYSWWEKCRFFEPRLNADGQALEKGTFVIPIPPPNVTGDLHIGHALTVAVQDCLIRWYRMRGFTVLYNPGFDHAGIATQTVVEKRLAKEKGQTRHDLGRPAFLELVHAWKDQYQQRISDQLRSLGASYDWTRTRFTMDEQMSKAVIEAFVRFHEDGTIYRANRLVNFCTVLNTTLSTIEVDSKELAGRTYINVAGYGPDEKFEFGALTEFAYPIKDSDERIIVATTRPETMLGDTAIAVHPEDSRYTHLHGKFAVHPFIPDRKIPIITDAEAVDMSFGTGAVKITPAHDFNDYAVGQRHNLEFINILNDDGTLNENCGRFKGVRRMHARGLIKHELKELGLLGETKNNPMSIPICSRSGDVVEPIMKPQWYVNCQDMAADALKRFNEGELNVRPAGSAAELQRWLTSIQDWCISRQLWWGHQCPVYLVHVDGQPAPDAADGSSWIAGRTKAEAEEKARAKYPGKSFRLEQDEDVLDTWFSSGLFPFAIMGWPEKTPDMESFYPNTLLETGWDIIFFWVARMVMLGLKLTGQMPFPEVFCHGLVRDAQGRKMSKSLGNVVNPNDVIRGISLEALHQQLQSGNLAQKEIDLATKDQKKSYPKGIPQCGTDALRFTLCNYTTGGRDANLDVERVHGYRQWCNKLWNMTRFAARSFDANFKPRATAQVSGKESLVEKWILHKLDVAVEQVNEALEARRFSHATEAAHSFQLYALCDVYLEAMKPLVSDPAATESVQQTLYTCLDSTFRLLHPFMPFVTEELWQRLPRRESEKAESIMLAEYPTADSSFRNAQAESDFDIAFNAVKAARSIGDGVGLRTELNWYIEVANDRLRETLQAEQIVLRTLVKGTSSLTIVKSASEVPAGCLSEPVSSGVIVHLSAAGRIDIDAEVAKVEAKKARAMQSQQTIRKIQSGATYDQLDDEVKQQNIQKLNDRQAEIDAHDDTIARLSALRI